MECGLSSLSVGRYFVTMPNSLHAYIAYALGSPPPFIGGTGYTHRIHCPLSETITLRDYNKMYRCNTIRKQVCSYTCEDSRNDYQWSFVPIGSHPRPSANPSPVIPSEHPQTASSLTLVQMAFSAQGLSSQGSTNHNSSLTRRQRP